MSLTTRNHCKQRAVRRQLFPEKLWDLVNKPSSGIQWSPDGKKIEVERTQLEKFIGTKFRSHNFDSFIRQLHFYGFRKSGNSYHHDKFQRGRPEALLTMKRKYSNLALAPLCNVNPHSPYYTSNTSSNDSTISNAAPSNANGIAVDSSGSGASCHGGGSTITNKNNSNISIPRAVHSNDCAIDYSITRQKPSVPKSPSKSVSKQQQQPLVQPSGSRPKNGAKEITMYTMRPIESIEVDSRQATATTNTLISSFTNIREESVQADRKDKTIRITIPEILKDTEQMDLMGCGQMKTTCNNSLPISTSALSLYLCIQEYSYYVSK